MPTDQEVAAEVTMRFGFAISMLIRGAIEEMVQRGLDRNASATALQSILQYVIDKGPAPYGPAVDATGVAGQLEQGQEQPPTLEEPPK